MTTAPNIQRLNLAVEKFDAMTGGKLDKSDPWAMVIHCEALAEKATSTTDAAAWYRLALEIKDAEAGLNEKGKE